MEILARASERGRGAALEYMGFLTSEQLLHLLRATRVQLVDMRPRRTRPHAVAAILCNEWSPALQRTQQFVQELRERVDRTEVVVLVAAQLLVEPRVVPPQPLEQQ